MKIIKLVVHHSASSRVKTTKKDIEEWHKKRGFNGIGYHKVIEGSGNVVDGRSESTQGAHAKGANQGSLGVCVVGNFEKETPTEKQVASLANVLTKWCQDYGLDEKKIFGHYNVPNGTTKTACPGEQLKFKLPTIKLNVQKKLKK